MELDWTKVTNAELEQLLLRYADDIAAEGRSRAPQCMREVAARFVRGESGARALWAYRIIGRNAAKNMTFVWPAEVASDANAIKRAEKLVRDDPSLAEEP